MGIPVAIADLSVLISSVLKGIIPFRISDNSLRIQLVELTRPSFHGSPSRRRAFEQRSRSLFVKFVV
jgi:hypothetical protein